MVLGAILELSLQLLIEFPPYRFPSQVLKMLPHRSASPVQDSGAQARTNAWHLVVLGSLLLAGWSSLFTRSTLGADRPNVLIILTDDQGWGDLSLHGNTNLSTPNIDGLARGGARFDRFFVCPVCSPTRAELLTGRYHPRSSVTSTSTGGERLDLDERLLPQLFHSAGYETAAFGKWHNGSQPPYHPCTRGFNEFYGFCSGHWGDYFSPPLEINGEPVQGDGYITDDFTNRAIDFLDRGRTRPFFLYVAYNSPHSPMQVPDRWWNKFKDKKLSSLAEPDQKEDLDFTRAALAMVENVDWNVGRILEKLQESKQADNTIVIFFCDNGPNSFRWNGGMKGRKGSTDEGGIRSPLFVRWPKKIPSGRLVTQICSAIDLLPTLTDLAQVPTTGTHPLDGRSLKPLLTGETAALPERPVFSTWAGKTSIRTQQFRLDSQGKLYDMISDPGQKQDVSKKFPEIRAELSEQVSKWRQEVLDGYTQDYRPFTIGNLDFPITHLPARDARPQGSIERSARAPNCSYLTNWKSVDDRIVWPADVRQPGLYRAEIYYACKKENVGVELELALGGNKVTGKVIEAHDPPARGDEHDLVSRDSESLVKDWKVMTLGNIQLDHGEQELALRATSIPGTEAIEFRQLTLRLIDVKQTTK